MEKQFTMETIYEFAAVKGVAKEDVTIQVDRGYWYDENDVEHEGEIEGYTVYFQTNYDEEFIFWFDSLDEPATEWEHHVSNGWEL